MRLVGAEMTEPRKALHATGEETKLVSPANGRVRGWKHHYPADAFKAPNPASLGSSDSLRG